VAQPEGRLLKIYVASSWRNEQQPEIVRKLRQACYQVYDFRHPDSGGPPGVPGSTRGKGFAWSDIDPEWMAWRAQEFRDLLLSHPIAAEGFESDAAALAWCDVCVLLLPSGRSAHIEAGWAVGAGKPLLILLAAENEPELMYRFARHICVSGEELLQSLWIEERLLEERRRGRRGG
jgi:hypothetical protein